MILACTYALPLKLAKFTMSEIQIMDDLYSKLSSRAQEVQSTVTDQTFSGNIKIEVVCVSGFS
jgi:hypothetical protein